MRLPPNKARDFEARPSACGTSARTGSRSTARSSVLRCVGDPRNTDAVKPLQGGILESVSRRVREQRSDRARWRGLMVRSAGGVVATAMFALFGSGALAAGGGSAVGQPPPEWAQNAGSWPSHNANLSNARANLRTDIDAGDVSKLKQSWTFPLPYVGTYGAFTSNPIVLGGVVYLEDPDSDVFALNQKTGAVIWKDAYKSVTPSGGPNGVALGYGLLFGETENSVFALDPKTGKQVWIRKLTSNSNEGIDMAPQLYDGKLLISTIPGNSKSFYLAGAYGILYALDARTGMVRWSFSTVKGGGALWGDPKTNDGGGLWYPPAVDSRGRVFIGVANPGPWPSTADNPNAKSRPGPNLYTDSLVALNGTTGKLLWYRQITAHDVRDYDFQDSPIITTQKIARQQHRDRYRRRQVGQGRRLPCRERQAPLDAERRQAQRLPVRPTTGEACHLLPRLGRRRRNPDGRVRQGPRRPLDRPLLDGARQPGSPPASAPPRAGWQPSMRRTAPSSGSARSRTWTSARQRSRTTSSSPPPSTAPSTRSRPGTARCSGRPKHPPASTRSPQSPRRC